MSSSVIQGLALITSIAILLPEFIQVCRGRPRTFSNGTYGFFLINKSLWLTIGIQDNVSILTLTCIVSIILLVFIGLLPLVYSRF